MNMNIMKLSFRRDKEIDSPTTARRQDERYDLILPSNSGVWREDELQHDARTS